MGSYMKKCKLLVVLLSVLFAVFSNFHNLTAMDEDLKKLVEEQLKVRLKLNGYNGGIYCPITINHTTLIDLLQEFASNECVITKLYLKECTSIDWSKVDFEKLGKLLSNLEVLDLTETGIDIRSLIKLLKTGLNKSLKRLNLSHCYKINLYEEAEVTELAELLNNVEELDLCETVISLENCAILLKKGCKNLKKFDFRGLCLLDSSEAELTEFGKLLKNIEILDFSRVRINGPALTRLLKKCKKLKELRLKWWCNPMGWSETNMAELTKALNNVEILDLTNRGMDDLTLVTLLKGCKNLKKIILNGCSKVTEKKVRDLMIKYPNLKFNHDF